MDFTKYESELKFGSDYPKKKYACIVYDENCEVERVFDEYYDYFEYSKAWRIKNGITDESIVPKTKFVCSNKDEYNRQVIEYEQQKEQLFEKFKEEMYEEFGITNNPKRELLYENILEITSREDFEDVYDNYKIFIDLII